MKQSESLLASLLSGSTITRASHPALVSLLELAAQGPGLEKGEEREKWAPRISRQWHLVAEAFRDVEKAGATDALVLSLQPYDGLRFSKGQWTLSPFVKRDYRLRIAAFLNHISDCLKAKRLLAQVGL